jgi:hypothetical protein
MRASSRPTTSLGCLLVGSALLLLSACGTSHKSKATGAGGDGDEPNGSGAASSGASDAGGQGNGPQSPGDFNSIWRPASAEHRVLDTATPTEGETVNVDVPKRVQVNFPDIDQEVEFFQQFVDDQMITFAYPVDGEVYYRITRSAMQADEAYIVTSGSAQNIFQIEDGVLTQMSTLAQGTQLVFTTTTFQKYEGDFPPADWPTEVVEMDTTGVLP